MLEVKVIMNSSVEDVIGFKCCSLPDQNLEIHVKNLGRNALKVPSRFELEGEGGVTELKTVYPPGGQLVQPGESAAFYCTMDEEVWKSVRAITAFDDKGKPFRAILQEN